MIREILRRWYYGLHSSWARMKTVQKKDVVKEVDNATVYQTRSYQRYKNIGKDKTVDVIKPKHADPAYKKWVVWEDGTESVIERYHFSEI